MRTWGDRYPIRTFRVGVALALMTAGAVIGAPGVQAAEITTSFASMFAFTPDPIQDYEGNQLWRQGPDSIAVTGSPAEGISVGVHNAGFANAYRMTFAAPAGDTLAVGAYEGAQRTSTREAGRPGVEVSRTNRQCAGTGRFDVLELAEDLSRFWVVFEHKCPGQAQAAFGEIRYNMPADANLLVTAKRISWPQADFQTGGRVLPVHLYNTGTTPVAVTATTISGDADFTGGYNNCGTLSPGSSCYVQASYRPLAVGPRSGTLTITADGAGTQSIELRAPGLDPADPGIGPYIGAPPPAVSLWKTEVNYDTVSFGFGSQWVPDYRDTVIRGAAGTVAPPTITSGFAVAPDGEQTATVPNLQDGRPYSFSFFARDLEGKVSAPTKVTVSAMKIGLSVQPSRVTYGKPLTLSGKVRDAIDNSAFPYRDVFLLAHDPRTNEVFEIEQTTTDFEGAYSFRITPDRTYDYGVVSPGTDSVLVGVAASAVIPVSMAVFTEQSKKSIKLGKTFVVATAVGPDVPGRTVVLEQLVGGKWKKIKSGKLNRESVRTFTVRPGKRGTFTYRAHIAGQGTYAGGTSKTFRVKVT